MNYKFKLKEDKVIYVYNPRIRMCAPHLFKFDNLGYLEISGKVLKFTIKAGYAWDGCSPKVKILNRIVGIPDGLIDADTMLPVTHDSSLVHDILYQFLGKHSLSRKEVDYTFYYLMKKAKFLPAPIYFLAVRLFGRLAISVSRKEGTETHK